ncbi:LysE family translocator [Halobaculum magnesiiphilum]|uniref:LysE family translocator n=1 Tax=Halobaculum magnesiiphilum TaxID=1017351 RepID=A0A8T8W9L8_9EURY|nr:LysE family translocator [Halobaculum magnesiiphilum]
MLARPPASLCFSPLARSRRGRSRAGARHGCRRIGSHRNHFTRHREPGDVFGLDAATLAAYVAAAGALILVPGQDTLVVLTRGFASRAAGVGAAVGVAVGVLIHATAAALGLAAVYRAVPAAATLVTLAGAAYLLWLAIDTAKGHGFGSRPRDGRPSDARPDGGPAEPGTGTVSDGFRRGLLTNVANPKVALFFLAFLPGFAGDGEPTTMVALGAVYALLTVAYLGAVGALAGRIGAVATGRTARAIRLGSAAVLVALAAALIVRVV